MNTWGRDREVEKVKPGPPTEEYPVGRLGPGDDQPTLLVIDASVGSPSDMPGWYVWLNVEGGKDARSGLCVGFGPTREEAMQEADEVFERARLCLQVGATAAGTPVVPHGRNRAEAGWAQATVSYQVRTRNTKGNLESESREFGTPEAASAELRRLALLTPFDTLLWVERVSTLRERIDPPPEAGETR